MSKVNYFSASVACPHCRNEGVIHFDADIGVLAYNTYEIGDVVLDTVPPTGRPLGPALDGNMDWERPFWAVGFGRCPHCAESVASRIDIRDRRFVALHPTAEPLDTFAWDYLSD